jgi:hypothetical protein
LAIPFPKDEGLAVRRIRLDEPQPIRIEVGRNPNGTVTLRLLGKSLPPGERGWEALVRTVGAVHRAGPDLRCRIDIAAVVPHGEVVSLLDRLLEVGVAVDGRDLLPRFAPPTKLFSPAEDVPDGALPETVEELEALLVRRPADLERVRELLGNQEHSVAGLRELAGKMRVSTELRLALARALLKRGDPDDLLRSLTLFGIVAMDPQKRYSRPWWQAELGKLEVLLAMGTSPRDSSIPRRLRRNVDAFEHLGLLDGSPVADEIRAVRAKVGEQAGGR